MGKAYMRRQTENCLWDVFPVWEGRKELARGALVSELVAQLLYNRGVSDTETVRSFLQPTLKDLIEPQKLIGMKAAVERIRLALAEEEKIVLYGDYDVDGIVGVSI